MFNIIHRVGIKAPLPDIYVALSTVEGLAGWWTTHVTGVSAVGETIHFEFLAQDGERLGGMGMHVLALVPDTEVRWCCTDGPEEWLGTDIMFNLSQEGDYSIVRFSHENWREAVEFTAHCSTKWATFLLSLKARVESGTGRPAPDDIKIDNWN